MAEQGSGRPQDSSDKHDAPSDKSSTGAKAPTHARPHCLGAEEARNFVDRLAGPGSRNGPPGRNDSVIQHEDHISFSGSAHVAHTAIDMMAQAIGDDKNACLGFIVFEQKPEPKRPLGDKGFTVVSGGTGVTVSEAGRFTELRAASAALAREQEKAVEDQLRPKEPAPEVKCGGCGSKTHQLLSCLKAAPNGLMKGCPKCNTTSHDVDACPKLKDIKTSFRLLVFKRGHMPAFATDNPDFHWAAVLRQWRVEEELRGWRHRNVPRLPWTPEFTQQLVEAQVQHYQERLDKGGIMKAHLPIDPATMDWAAARRTYPAAEAPSSETQDKAARVTKSGKSGDHADNLPTESKFVEDNEIDWWRW